MRRKSLEIPMVQGVCQRQYLQRAGNPLHLRIQHETNAVNRFKHALGRVLAVLLVLIENNAGREKYQRQRGSRNQKGKTHWQ